jgi:hypothetical protein
VPPEELPEARSVFTEVGGKTVDDPGSGIRR